MLYDFKRGTNATKTIQENNENFGKNLVNVFTVQRCIRKFKEDNHYLENEKRGEPDFVLDNNELQKDFEANPRKTTRELAEELNVSKSTIFNHLKKIEKTKKLDK